MNITEGTTFDLVHANRQLTIDAIPNIVLTIIYLIFGCIGNACVIYIYAFATKGDIKNRYFILVLAVVDMISCIVNCVFTVVLDSMQIIFTSSIFCKVLRVLCHVTALSSAFILLAIAIQRYQLVCKPLGTQMSPFVRKLGVVVCLISSGLLGFPAVVFYGSAPVTRLGFNGTACKYSEHYIGSTELLVYNGVFMLTCVSGIIAVSVLYFLVVRKIYKQRNKFPNRNQSKAKTQGTNETSMTLSDSENPSDSRLDYSSSATLDRGSTINKTNMVDSMSKSKSSGSLDSKIFTRKSSLASGAKFSVRSKSSKVKESLKNHRFSMMFVTVTIVCVISFIPLRSLEMMETKDKTFVETTFGNSLWLYRFLYNSYIINNIANPLIYGLFDRQFRKKFKQIFIRS